nr:serine/threonine-protein kinase ppk4 [Quercus suber]
MQSRSTPVCLKSLLIWSLILPLTAALQQQANSHAIPSPSAFDQLGDAAQRRWRASNLDSIDPLLSGQRGYKNTHTERDRKEKARTRTSKHDERALATLSPAESDPAVRAPPALRSTSTVGLSSRQPARSLQDWQVEDIILLATVDGKIHARDRTTGAPRWQLETDRPMVETIYHRHNKSTDENGMEQDDPLWIVEPSQDGSIYVYAPGAGFGMQKLGYTVKQLAELAPYASEGQPAVAYTAEKKTTLYTVDAGTGNILKMFSSSGSITNADQSCRRVNPLELLDEDECETIGTLTLGQTEYIIGIQDRNTGEQISTLKYFEWAPNNRDQDLKNKYTRTMDRKYVYTKHDGTIFGFDLGNHKDWRAVGASKPIYHEKLSSPVARVFDVVRPADDQSSDASLVILPQPVGPSLNEFAELEDNESIFVNCTAGGSWYALSESNYPAVTDGATTAKCYAEDFFSVSTLPMSKKYREKFVGVHQLSPQTQTPGTPLIGAPEYPGIDAPPPREIASDSPDNVPSDWRQHMPSVGSALLAIFITLAACVVLYQQKVSSGTENVRAELPNIPVPVETAMTVPTSSVDEEVPATPKVREQEPAMETIFPVEESTLLEENAHEDEPLVLTKSNGPGESPDTNAKGEPADTPKKGAHKRGKRSGRKQKEKEAAAAEARARKTGQMPQPLAIAKPPEVISVADSESPQVSGPLQINSLIINTDRVIGQGSCGTSVFEGSFEGRDVAVKRMLSQYYELASQEVSFLQQSDDHPNVVRYFCQQKDSHFLYIAVELCQASLFEVWEAEKAKSEERQVQLRSLKLSIQQDVPKALQQLAAGLYHLHNLRIIHRDIKPQNILVAFPKKHQNSGPRLVISDFGLGKNLPENVSTLIDPTGNAGTSGWKAPELISQPRDTLSQHSQSASQTSGSETASGVPSGVKRAADIFSLGCLFFWVLTDGIHPYEDENGWQQLRELNIKRDYKKMEVLERWSDAYEPMQLITSMLAHQPENRPTALQVFNHPFFWPAEKRLAFLCDVSDHFEREPRGVVDDDYYGDSDHLRFLEERVEEVVGASYHRADFLSKLDRHFVDTLGKQRKYSGNRLLDLLRALRNKKNHYEDMPEDVKRRVGPLAGGYLNYWCNRFPRLLMACYEVVHETGIQGSDRFKSYFVPGVV